MLSGWIILDVHDCSMYNNIVASSKCINENSTLQLSYMYIIEIANNAKIKKAFDSC